MSITLFFVAVIAVSLGITFLVTSLTSKLGKTESILKELTNLLETSDFSQPEKIQKLQTAYQKAVDKYNRYISNFPGAVTAKLFGFEQITDENSNFQYLEDLLNELPKITEESENPQIILEETEETEENSTL
ncbi:MAG: LemA family protein [Firmicutes bacterium]|nr:LemA family protein [Bacillota bacterium]